MPSRSRERSAETRAEARRRARLQARGEATDEELEEPAPDEPPARRGLLGRLFPPAPPLPDKPDPLAGFTGGGWTRPITVRLYLLRQNLFAWAIPGVVAGIGFYLSLRYGTTALGLIATLIMFSGLVGAGWFGWQRPTLYGTIAAILGYLLAVPVILMDYARLGVTPETFGSPLQVVIGLTPQGIYQAVFGFVAGWYGGYLRRRQTHLQSQLRADRRRRR